MSTRSSTASSPAPERRQRLRALAAAGILALISSGAAADAPEAIAEQAAPDGAAQPPALDPVSEAVESDALTQIRISAIAFQDPKDLGQALSGVIGAFLKRDRLKDALVDLSVVKDPVWRAYALLHIAQFRFERGELTAAAALLKEADGLTRQIAAQSDEAVVLRLVSQQQAEYGDYATARKTAARIADLDQRIARFVELAEMQAADPNKRVAAGGADSLRTAFEDVKTSSLAKEDRVRPVMTLADRAISLGYRDLAQKMLEYCYALRPGDTVGKSVPAIADLAAAMVRAGDRGRAMEIVRALKSDVRRGYALASVARAFAETGNVEGAVPLFYLAIQDAESQEKGEIKIHLLTHLVEEQTYAGRLADAFSTAGRIKDAEAQRGALYAMAGILFEQGKPMEALKVADYTPDPGMRAEILGRAAIADIDTGNAKEAEALLRRAMEPTGAKPAAATLAKGLPLLFEAIYGLKKGQARDSLLASARKLLARMPDDAAKVPVLARIARAEMRGQDKDAADRSLGAAWRIAWFNKDKEFFPELLREIAMAQLAVGDLLLAFDTAARISGNPAAEVDSLEYLLDRRASARVSALTAVAVAAARRGEAQLALRAARSILDPSGRATAYREIALAFPISGQQAKLGIGAVPMHPDTPASRRISPAVEGAPMPRPR